MSGRSSRESWMLLSFSSRQDSRSSIRSWAANQRWVLWRLEAGPITAHLAAVHVRHDLVHGVLGLQTVDIRTMGMNKDKRTLKGKTTQTSGSRLSEVKMFMLNICGRCPARAKHGDNAWKHSEIWVNGEWWGPAPRPHTWKTLSTVPLSAADHPSVFTITKRAPPVPISCLLTVGSTPG